MKKSLLLSALFISVFCLISSAQTQANQKKDPVGKWKFDVPAAPEGYQTGTIVIGLAEGKHNAGIIFSNFDYKFPGERVKCSNDSVSFAVNLEGQYVEIKLKMETSTKMTGAAISPDGPIPVVLTKEAIEPK
ncbi:MAG: hypothetical protein MUE74_08940 [Bacteroidales bacterium]|nr:hypothetical protein [Bacteroidales bacterium]